jgi:hypothetical protein
MLGDARPRALAQLLDAAAAGDADDRNVQLAAPHHRVKRRKDLFVGEVAGRAEQDQGVGWSGCHRRLGPDGCSPWPPN